MKRFMTLLLSIAFLLTACAPEQEEKVLQSEEKPEEINITPEQFSNIGDPELLRYVEENVYTGLENTIDSKNYEIVSVTAIYISQEYINEMTFNSQSNIFFGYTIAELDEMFHGTKYMFTSDNDGQTTVKEMEIIEEDTTEDIIGDIAVTAGVIVICVCLTKCGAGFAIDPVVTAFITLTAEESSVLYENAGLVGSLAGGVTNAICKKDFKKIQNVGKTLVEKIDWRAVGGYCEDVFAH